MIVNEVNSCYGYNFMDKQSMESDMTQWNIAQLQWVYYYVNQHWFEPLLLSAFFFLNEGSQKGKIPK